MSESRRGARSTIAMARRGAAAGAIVLGAMLLMTSPSTSNEGRLAILKSGLRDSLRELDRESHQIEARVAVCESRAQRAQDWTVPDQDIERTLNASELEIRSFPGTLQEVERVVSEAKQKATIADKAAQAADKACAETSEQQAVGDGNDLRSAASEAQAAFDAIRAKIGTLLKKVGATNFRTELPSLRSRLGSIERCKSWPSQRERLDDDIYTLKSGQKSIDWKETTTKTEANLREADRLAGLSDFELQLMKTRLAQLQTQVEKQSTRFSACRQRVEDADKSCQPVDLSGRYREIDRLIAELEILDRRRDAARGSLRGAESIVSGWLSDVKRAASRGQACIDKRGGSKSACSKNEIDRDFILANANYHSERYDEAKADLKAIVGKHGHCPGVPERADKADKQVDRVKDASTRIGTAAGNCNVPAMREHLASLKRIRRPHPAMHGWIKDIEERLPGCRDTWIADAHADCRLSAGPGYSAKILTDGGYYCIPDKNTADNWCKAQRSGWQTQSVSETGIIECRPGSEAQTAICRDKYGDKASATGYSGGKVSCRLPPKPKRADKPQRPRGQGQPVYRDPGYDAAVAATVTSILIQTIISSQSNARRPPTMAAPQSRCHYNRFGKLHCGGG